MPLVLAECFLRRPAKLDVFTDILRNYYVNGYIAWQAYSGNGHHPDYQFNSENPIVPLVFTTKECPAGGMGYRINGIPEDNQPVFAVALGDSYTEGIHFNDFETWPCLLGRMTGKNFVNMGMGGAGTTDHLLRLKFSGFMSQKPKLIILQVCGNDVLTDKRKGAFIQFAEDETFLRKMKASMTNVQLEERRETPRAIKSVFLFFIRSIILPRLKIWGETFTKSWGKQKDLSARQQQNVVKRKAGRKIKRKTGKKNFLDNIRYLHEWTQRESINLLVVEMGEWEGDVCLDALGINESETFAVLRGTLKDIDPSHNTIMWDGHPNANGLRIIARRIYKRLKEKGWLNPK